MAVKSKYLKGNLTLPKPIGKNIRIDDLKENAPYWSLAENPPKKMILQTEPQFQEVSGIKEKGQEYYIQNKEVRPDTGELSGAKPSEAASWGEDRSGSTSRQGRCVCRYGHCHVHYGIVCTRKGKTSKIETLNGFSAKESRFIKGRIFSCTCKKEVQNLIHNPAQQPVHFK